MYRALFTLALLGTPLAPAVAQVDIGIGINLPSVNIGIDLPAYPRLVPVPGRPVYYAPQVQGNYFFYDGLYWVLEDDDWYSSGWYNGPWHRVRREVVPVYVLQIPVRYYRRPPPYFRGWQRDAAPRWGERWGPQWQDGRRHWDRRSDPIPRAPLPMYQRPYAGERYPDRQQQWDLNDRRYRFQPRDEQVRNIMRDQRGMPPPGERGDAPGRSPPDRDDRDRRDDRDHRDNRGQERKSERQR